MPQGRQEGVVVAVHEPVRKFPALHEVVQGRQACSEPGLGLYAPLGQAEHAALVVSEHVDNRYCPLLQEETQVLQLVCVPATS